VFETIRLETPADHRRVEEITRAAFWNLHGPGCDEHYLAHILRNHPDFISELDYLIEVDGVVVGSIMYTRSTLVDEAGREEPVLTFGPVSVLPEYQGRGIGSRLISFTFQEALKLGYPGNVIFGNPGHYVGLGFRSCARFGISTPDHRFPTALLVKELSPGALENRKRVFRESQAYGFESEAAAKFDAGFESRAREVRPQHEEFYILSRSTIRPEE